MATPQGVTSDDRYIRVFIMANSNHIDLVIHHNVYMYRIEMIIFIILQAVIQTLELCVDYKVIIMISTDYRYIENYDVTSKQSEGSYI